MTDEQSDFSMERLFDVWEAAPIIKWPGGKRRLARRIINLFPFAEINCYWEPFFGGGAVFFSGRRSSNSAVLSDINARLMNMYRGVKEHPQEVVTLLEGHAANHSSEEYYAVRKKYNSGIVGPEGAAALIYMNRSGYNGLYRENADGQMNVAWGHREAYSVDRENIFNASKALNSKGVTLETGSYELVNPTVGDVVYCDPPYHSTFSKYKSDDFSEDDHTKLRNEALGWLAKGSTVVISNSDTPFTRELYKDFMVHSLQVTTTIGLTPESRRSASELLAVGKP